MERVKECNHNWKLVYYGSEPDVECGKCNIGLNEVHTHDESHMIIKKLLKNA